MNKDTLITRWILGLFLFCLLYLGFNVYTLAMRNVNEYSINSEELINTNTDQSEHNEKILKTAWSLKVYHFDGITVTTKPETNKIQRNLVVSEKTTKKEESLIDKLKWKELDWTNTRLSIPWYLDKGAKVIWSKDNSRVYEELLEGVRAAPFSTRPVWPGLIFMEGHSWQNYRNTLSYSFFDNLALYYDKIDQWTKLVIENDDYKFEYELFKKEIVLPGEREIRETDESQLVIMTCYPRNSSEKRALFYSKLVNVIPKK